MVSKHRFYTILISGVFLLIIDQVAKSIAVANPTIVWYVWRPWIGWEYFLNTGIAFSLPFPAPLLLVITPIILGVLLYWFLYLPRHERHLSTHVGIVGIVCGAISNFVDRVVYGATVDYLRIFTAVINIADILIVLGVLALLFHLQKEAPRLP